MFLLSVGIKPAAGRAARSNKGDMCNCWQEGPVTVLQIDGIRRVNRRYAVPGRLLQPSVTIRSAGVAQKATGRPFAGDCIVHQQCLYGPQNDAQNPWV